MNCTYSGTLQVNVLPHAAHELGAVDIFTDRACPKSAVGLPSETKKTSQQHLSHTVPAITHRAAVRKHCYVMMRLSAKGYVASAEGHVSACSIN